MTRISTLNIDDCDHELRELSTADSATPIEQGLTRMFAHSPEVAKA